MREYDLDHGDKYRKRTVQGIGYGRDKSKLSQMGKHLDQGGQDQQQRRIITDSLKKGEKPQKAGLADAVEAVRFVDKEKNA